MAECRTDAAKHQKSNATATGGKSKSKGKIQGKTFDINQLLAEVPLPAIVNWGEVVEQQQQAPAVEQVQRALPSAPRSECAPHQLLASLPTEPPFTAVCTNIEWSVNDRQLFAWVVNVMQSEPVKAQLHKPAGANTHSGRGFVTFNTVEELATFLQKEQTPLLNNRAVRVDVYTPLAPTQQRPPNVRAPNDDQRGQRNYGGNYANQAPNYDSYPRNRTGGDSYRGQDGHGYSRGGGNHYGGGPPAVSAGGGGGGRGDVRGGGYPPLHPPQQPPHDDYRRNQHQPPPPPGGNYQQHRPGSPPVGAYAANQPPAPYGYHGGRDEYGAHQPMSSYPQQAHDLPPPARGGYDHGPNYDDRFPQQQGYANRQRGPPPHHQGGPPPGRQQHDQQQYQNRGGDYDPRRHGPPAQAYNQQNFRRNDYSHAPDRGPYGGPPPGGRHPIDGQSHEHHEEPKERPKLHLLPRSASEMICVPSAAANSDVAMPASGGAVAAAPKRSTSIFGEAKPVDLPAKRDAEIEQRLLHEEEERRRKHIEEQQRLRNRGQPQHPLRVDTHRMSERTISQSSSGGAMKSPGQSQFSADNVQLAPQRSNNATAPMKLLTRHVSHDDALTHDPSQNVWHGDEHKSAARPRQASDESATMPEGGDARTTSNGGGDVETGDYYPHATATDNAAGHMPQPPSATAPPQERRGSADRNTTGERIYTRGGRGVFERGHGPRRGGGGRGGGRGPAGYHQNRNAAGGGVPGGAEASMPQTVPEGVVTASAADARPEQQSQQRGGGGHHTLPRARGSGETAPPHAPQHHKGRSGRGHRGGDHRNAAGAEQPPRFQNRRGQTEEKGDSKKNASSNRPAASSSSSSTPRPLLTLDPKPPPTFADANRFAHLNIDDAADMECP